MNTNPGIHTLEDPDDYHHINAGKQKGDPGWIVSRSDLLAVHHCPQEWVEAPPKTPTASMRLGSLVDCMTLTPHLIAKRYTVRPDTYTSAPDPSTVALTTGFPGGDWNPRTKPCREWKAKQEAEGKTVLTPDQLAEASKPKDWHASSATCQKIIADNHAKGIDTIDPETWATAETMTANINDRVVDDVGRLGDIIAASQTQAMAIADVTEPETGITVRLRVLLDILPPHEAMGLVDLKTALHLHPDKWRAEIPKFGYDVQAAMYLHVWNLASGETRSAFSHFIVGNQAPHLTAARSMSESYLDLGLYKFRRALASYCRCIRDDRWPGYSPSGIEEVEPTEWELRKAGMI